MTTVEVGTLRIRRAALAGVSVADVEHAVRRALVEQLSGVPAIEAHRALQEGTLRIQVARAPGGAGREQGERS